MMTALSCLAAFLTAGLAGAGVGGAGLLVLWLTLAETLPQTAAQALNLFCFLAAAGAATVVNACRAALPWAPLALASLGGLAGAFGGTALAVRLPAGLLRRICGGVLVLLGARGAFFAKKISKSPLQEPKDMI